jgi:hypothetical protein
MIDSTGTGGDPAEPQIGTIDEVLRAALLARMAADQDARHAHAAEADRGEAAWAAVAAVDADNLAFLEPLINMKGWLGSDLVGEDGAHACWLLVQHAPDHLQERWLPLLRVAVAAGSASAGDLAYLQDRVDLHNHRRQQYGTQHVGIRASPIRLWPVTDATGINTRRTRLDLPPITQDVLDGAWTTDALAEHGIHLDGPEIQDRKWDSPIL